MRNIPQWPDIAPDTYIDEDGKKHDWDDRVPDEGEGVLDGPESITYRELAYDLATAEGLSLDTFMARQQLRHRASDQDL